MPEDPVCGERVREDTPYRLELESKTYYFCGQDCAEQFLENSQEYVSSIQESMGE